MKKKKTRALAIGGLIVVAMGAIGCSSSTQDSAPATSGSPDSSSLVADAKAEGTVTWYTAYAEDRARVAADAFTAEYGIPVEIVRAGSPALLQRYTAERDANATVADLIDYSGPEPFREAPEGEFVALDGAGTSSLQQWPTDQIIAGIAPRLSLEPLGIAYNTELLAGDDAPGEWEDIFRAPIRDQVSTPIWDSPSYLTFLQMQRDEFGDDRIAEIADLDSTTYDSGLAAMQAVAAGEHAILFPTAASFVIPLQKAGAPVDFVVPSPTIGIVVYAAVPAPAPHPSAGMLLLDFLMSTAGQSAIGNGQSASVLHDVPGSLTLDGIEIVGTERSAALAAREELLALVD